MGGVISYMGDDYIAPSVEIQSDAHATDLDNSKVQTGQTIKSYIKANENIPISEADYAALTPEEIAEGKTYFRYEAPSLMRDIQDDGAATSLTSGSLPTGQTITSYLNSNLLVYKGLAKNTSTDYNLINTTGIYYNDSTTMTNAPVNYVYSYLFVLRLGASITQIQIKPITKCICIREFSGYPAKWGNWVTFTGV